MPRSNDENVKPGDEALFDSAIANLSGTSANYLQAILSFGLALGVTINGLSTASINDDSYVKSFLYLAIAFMVSSMFVAAKTVRDGQLADLFPTVPWMQHKSKHRQQ